MATDHIAPTAAPSRWRRLVDALHRFAVAMDSTYDEVQDRRIAALEAEIAVLRQPPAPR